MSGEADKVVDWEVVEKHYRAGLKSLRTIAEEHGITEGAIRKRAKRDKWTRDLEKKIQERAKEKVRKEAVRKPGTQLTPQTEQQVVEQYSDVVASVDMIQREDVKLAIDNSRNQLKELVLLGDPDFAAALESLGDLMDVSAPGKPDRANELYRYIISLAGRVKMAKEIAASHGVYIPMQRKIFGLDNEKKSTGEFEEMLRRVQLQPD
jgi:predicted DNA-binding protein YlxM (UPF0122 family)